MSRRARRADSTHKSDVERRLKKGDGLLARIKQSVSKEKPAHAPQTHQPVTGSSPMRKLKRSHLRTRRFVQDFFKDAPRGRLPRIVWFLHPKRQFHFWFSKNGLFLGLKLAAVGFAGLVLLFGLVYAYYSNDLRSKDLRNLSFTEATKFYDRTGKHLLYSIYGDENRTVVDFDKISKYAKYATISIEDKNFYSHHGLSIRGIVRAGFNNLIGKRSYTSGGSTITQQYVKNALLTKEKSIERKAKEAILSLEMERLYSKDEILGFYLNEIPYGGTAYGVEAAARSFFNKPAAELTIDESAMLAAIPQAPTFYSPYGENTDKLMGRTHYIIDLMREQNYITQEESDKAKAVKTLKKLNKNFRAYRDIKAPYFVLEVQRRLEETYGASVVATSGWKIITTVDMGLQKKAERAIKDNMAVIDRAGGNNAALVASDPKTGQVLAAVGGRDFDHPVFGRFNGAFTALRQPGSSIKPYTYATLMKGNYGAGSIFYDLRTNFSDTFKPGNADGGFLGAITVRTALARSRNIPAVKALYIAGLEKVMDTWEKVGLKSSDLEPAHHGLSFGLGSAEVKLAEHVNGYETFANGGVHRDQALWLKITDQRDQVVDEWKGGPGKRVFDQQIAYSITDILSDENASRALWPGSLSGYNDVPGTPIAVKTGTTNNRKDAWMMGFSSRLTVGVWTGNTRPRLMTIITPYLVGPIFDQFMTEAHKGNPGESFKKSKPEGLKNARIDRYTGRAPLAGSSTITDIFPSWFKLPTAEGVEKFTVDTVSGKLATDCTPASARQEVSLGGIDAEIPPNDPAYPRWSPPVKAYARSIGQRAGYGVKPTESDDAHDCDDSGPKVESINVSDGVVTVAVTQGTFSIERVDIKIDGQIKRSFSGGNGSYSYTPNPPLDGSHTVGVLVVDSGKYQDTSSQTFDFGSGSSGSGPSITSPSQGHSFNNDSHVQIYWTGGTAPYKVSWLCGGGSGAITTSSTSFNPNSSQENDFEGACNVTVSSSSGSGPGDSVTFLIN